MYNGWMLIGILLLCILAVGCIILVGRTEKDKVLGSILIVDGDSMYVELKDETSLDKIKSSDYVVFEVINKKSPK